MTDLRKSGSSSPRHFGSLAERKAAADAYKPASRWCLGGCGKLFTPTHAGNRVCPACTTRNENSA